MSKDPAFLFYPNDYLGGTMGFSFNQHGLYVLALIFQFNNGHFSEAQINSILNNQFNEIKSKFKTDGKLFWNERLDIEKEKRSKYVESRQNNGRSFLLKKDKPLINKKIDVKHMGSGFVPHMENENEDDNSIRNSHDLGKYENPLWRENSDAGYAEYLRISEPEWDKIQNDWNWIELRKEFYPGVCVKKTLDKMWLDFWGTKAGWQNKRSKKTKTIDWEQTIINNFQKSRVFYGKGEADYEAEQIKRMKENHEI